MDKQDLKHTLLSLIIGVLTVAIAQFLNGFIEILQDWVTNALGGSTASVVYLKIKHFI